MHYLGLAVYAEGSSDYQFLRPLLQRVCEDVCINRANRSVDVTEVIPLNHEPSRNYASRQDRIVNAAIQHRGAWRIVFVHGDGGGDSTASRAALVQPGLNLLSIQFPDCRGVAVVPVRETEAWAIVDGDALRQVFCTNLTNSEMGIPSDARAVEANLDPKATLKAAYLATNPARQRRRHGVGSYLGALGESVSLDRLRLLRSFQAFECELTRSLDEIGIFR
jgi:hypothetical protein